MPIEIGVDNATAITFAAGTVKKGKLRHIDATEDWVQALRDSELVKLVKVGTKENYADIMTRILDPSTFAALREGILVNVAIPDSLAEQSSTSSSTTTGGRMLWRGVLVSRQDHRSRRSTPAR